MKRLFIGIPVPQDLHATLTERQSGLQGARWVAPENFHLTLCFLGKVPTHSALDIGLALSQVRSAPIELTLGNEDYFGKRRPHALYTKVERSDPLENLAAKVQTNTRAFAQTQESRKFTPHVTLGYLKDVTEKRVLQYLSEQPVRAPLKFQVTSFELIESHLRDSGPLYMTLAEFPLTD